MGDSVYLMCYQGKQSGMGTLRKIILCSNNIAQEFQYKVSANPHPCNNTQMFTVVLLGTEQVETTKNVYQLWMK